MTVGYSHFLILLARTAIIHLSLSYSVVDSCKSIRFLSLLRKKTTHTHCQWLSVYACCLADIPPSFFAIILGSKSFSSCSRRLSRKKRRGKVGWEWEKRGERPRQPADFLRHRSVGQANQPNNHGVKKEWLAVSRFGPAKNVCRGQNNLLWCCLEKKQPISSRRGLCTREYQSESFWAP